MWKKYKKGITIGKVGSENGIVIIDETYGDEARIILERDCGNTPFAITIGIYGLMVHTAFASSNGEAEKKYCEMKEDVKKLLDNWKAEEDDELDDWMDQFCNKY
ncbi:hypothetical protein ACFHWD_01295 [Clostridium sp. MT-14]|jgi:hypothetical protein|uniref:Uncharacterized protein n=1 Tax=Clostridium aromativorans TaxID=2836848 RepID=A0ABS8N3X6_9CLOT|nr:hypothetical protein [Clostridium aromativorans]MCC9293508.1 hypothetical protein [Clostridium aromativorans]